MKNFANRKRDCTGCKTCRSYLIKQRLELMEVVSIDQDYLKRLVGYFFSQSQTSEPRPDNYNAWKFTWW